MRGNWKHKINKNNGNIISFTIECSVGKFINTLPCMWVPYFCEHSVPKTLHKMDMQKYDTLTTPNSELNFFGLALKPITLMNLSI